MSHNCCAAPGKLDLSPQAARRFIDPEGDYAYTDSVSFAELVTVEDLRGAGLKIATHMELTCPMRQPRMSSTLYKYVYIYIYIYPQQELAPGLISRD